VTLLRGKFRGTCGERRENQISLKAAVATLSLQGDENKQIKTDFPGLKNVAFGVP
jgi:hypothetical protein